MNRPPHNSHNARRAHHDHRTFAPPALQTAPADLKATPSAVRALSSAAAPLPPWARVPCTLRTSAVGATRNRHTGAQRANLGLSQQQAATATKSAARERLPNPPTNERTGQDGRRTGRGPKQQKPHARAVGGGPAAGGLRGVGEALGGAWWLLLLLLRWSLLLLMMLLLVVLVVWLWMRKAGAQPGRGQQRWRPGGCPRKAGWRYANLGSRA